MCVNTGVALWDYSRAIPGPTYTPHSNCRSCRSWAVRLLTPLFDPVPLRREARRLARPIAIEALQLKHPALRRFEISGIGGHRYGHRAAAFTALKEKHVNERIVISLSVPMGLLTHGTTVVRNWTGCYPSERSKREETITKNQTMEPAAAMGHVLYGSGCCRRVVTSDAVLFLLTNGVRRGLRRAYSRGVAFRGVSQ